MAIRVGLQLYSVREDAAKDTSGVIAAVAKMGYEAVEFAGYYGHTAGELRGMLDENGLECCGTHTGLETLLGDDRVQQDARQQVSDRPRPRQGAAELEGRLGRDREGLRRDRREAEGARDAHGVSQPRGRVQADE